MTKDEFTSKTPWKIEHKTWGHSEREIIVDNEKKGVCYRNLENLSSFGAYGYNWTEVYEKLSKGLISEGYIKE